MPTRYLFALALAAALLFQPGAVAQQSPDTRVVTLPAPQNAASLPAATSRVAAANGLMWKATSATNTVYLVGSIHAGSPDMYPLPEQIEDAFRSSSVLVVEIDPGAGPLKMLSVLSTTGMYPQGESLWDHVSPRTRSLLTGFCTENGLDAEMLSRFKPWAASATISMLLVKAAGMKPELGIDQHFLEQARGSKRVDQLETVEQQVRMLQQIPVREEEQSLAESIANPEQSKQFLSKMKAAWLDGDAAAIDLLLSTELKSSQALQKVMFGDRNSRMAAAVERYLKGNEPCFVVVGAGHLVGKDGIVSLLRHKGFTVQQVLAAN